MRRRQFLLTAALLANPPARAAVEFPSVTPRPLVFPRDHGAHPDYRIEWWYLTGWLQNSNPPPPGESQGGGALSPIGFQVTFFRTRTTVDPDNPSRFAAHQLVIAHAAIAQPARGHLLHDQRIAREGFGLVYAATDDIDVALEHWSLKRRAADGAYAGSIAAREFALRFTARPTQPLLLQGNAGYSRKGPRPGQASYYYSQPQLAVDAELTLDAHTQRLAGRAWLDHEWSSTLLDPDAAGWDWIGMNLDGGGALTAFRIRRKGDGAPLWAYASLRANGDVPVQTFAPDAVRFETLSRWESPRTRGVYAVAQRITVGQRMFDTQPLFPDQELDSRASTGAVYWEGASTLLEEGRTAGRGYLELTGYVTPIVL